MGEQPPGPNSKYKYRTSRGLPKKTKPQPPIIPKIKKARDEWEEIQEEWEEISPSIGAVLYEAKAEEHNFEDLSDTINKIQRSIKDRNKALVNLNIAANLYEILKGSMNKRSAQIQSLAGKIAGAKDKLEEERKRFAQIQGDIKRAKLVDVLGGKIIAIYKAASDIYDKMPLAEHKLKKVTEAHQRILAMNYYLGTQIPVARNLLGSDIEQAKKKISAIINIRNSIKDKYKELLKCLSDFENTVKKVGVTKIGNSITKRINNIEKYLRKHPITYITGKGDVIGEYDK